MKNSARRQLHRLITSSILCGIVITSTRSNGIVISSGPSFVPAANAPLAGSLQLTTDVPSRVTVTVNDGQTTWSKTFYDYATSHSIPLLGFKPSRNNQITVTVFDKSWNAATAASPVIFNSPAQPSDFPPCVLLRSEPDKLEPGYTLFRILNRINNRAYVGIVDSLGEIVWYSGVATTADVRQLTNGDLFIPLSTSFVEINMLGNTVQTWNVPANLPINLHDGVPTPHGTILYLSDASRAETNFPTSATNPNAPRTTANVLFNKVVEISATNSALLNTWSPIDFLDPRRLTYLTFDMNTSLGWDIEHSNAVIEDPRDDTLIVSMRDQNCLVKFYRDTGAIKWILGPPANWTSAFQPYLFTPVGTPFQWQYGQHAPSYTPQGTLLVYDDGNYRASPFDPPLVNSNNFSRAVEYSINEQTMEISQVWDYGSDTNREFFYTGQVGNADWLPVTGNVLVNFGFVSFDNRYPPSPYSPSASMARIQEVSHDTPAELVWDLAFFDYSNTSHSYLGCYIYRSHRIADLYAHPAQPVADLMLDFDNNNPRLRFSADETRTYTVQASTDLSHWQELGDASDEGTGQFQFEDTDANSNLRYYRVVSH